VVITAGSTNACTTKGVAPRVGHEHGQHRVLAYR
jgi:hypothetical protein